MKMFAVLVKKAVFSLILFCFAMTLLMARTSVVYAVKNEQLAIDAYSLSLANSVTAEPNFLMAIHYNPAGLSMLGEGGYFAQGFIIAQLKRKGTFTEDPDWPGFMSGTWSPTNSNIYGDDNNPWPNPRDVQTETDPLSYHGGPDPLANTSGTNRGGVQYIPIPAIGRLHLPVSAGSTQGAARRQPGSRWTLGWGMYPPFAGGIDHGAKGDPHKFGVVYAYHQHYIYSAPTIAYEFSPQLAVGLSIGIAQRALGTKVYARSPKELTALTRVLGDATQDLNIPVVTDTTYPGPWYGGGIGPYDHVATVTLKLRDDFCPTFNLGLLWRPTPWFSLGACYRSQSKAQLTGNYTFVYSNQYRRMVDWFGKTELTMRGAGMLDNPFISVAKQTGTATATNTLPRIVALGVKFQPVDKLKILLNVNYANWSAAEKQLRVTLDQRIQPLRQAKMSGYVHGPNDIVKDLYSVDTWNVALGLEYRVSEKLTLRMGVEDRPGSANMSYFDLTSLIPDARLYGIGAGIKLPKGKTIDFALGTLQTETVRIKNNGSTNLNSTDFTKSGGYTGLDYKQELVVYVVGVTIRIPLDARKEQLSGVARKIKGLFKKLNPFTYIK